MKMIILAGASNTGKSATFNDVYGKMTRDMDPLPVKIQLGAEIDFETSFLYKEKRVALFSEGDTLYVIKEAIQKHAAQCDCFNPCVQRTF